MKSHLPAKILSKAHFFHEFPVHGNSVHKPGTTEREELKRAKKSANVLAGSSCFNNLRSGVLFSPNGRRGKKLMPSNICPGL